MKVTQEYKYRGPEGEMLSDTLELEFREIDRCRKADSHLFYAAMGLIHAQDVTYGFSPECIEKMGTLFIDQLLIKDVDFDEKAFTLLKNDTIAVFQVNLKLTEEVIAPFLTSNF